MDGKKLNFNLGWRKCTISKTYTLLVPANNFSPKQKNVYIRGVPTKNSCTYTVF